MTHLWRKSGRLSNEDANMLSSYQMQRHNHSIRSALHNPMWQHSSYRTPNQLKTGRRNENLTDNADTVVSPATNGPNAESASGRKRKTKMPTTNNNQPNPPTHKTSNRNTTRSWYAKYVAKWDTQPETATTEIRRRKTIGASRILNSRPRKTNSSAATSYRPTTGSTTRTNCPTPLMTKLTLSRKRRDTMT